MDPSPYSKVISVYRNKKILVTGCRGFKGSWMMLWLKMLGAQICGVGHAPNTEPNHSDLLNLVYPDRIELLEYDKLVQFMDEQKPELVFHFAAHPIITTGFNNPREYIWNNVMAATNILEASRHCESVKGIVFITSDKVYEDKNWIWGYKETDTLGGPDPYSTSKVCAEAVARCYIDSFEMPIAIARAGNVLGGGDWNHGRIIPDLVRAAAKKEFVNIHTPEATRPWQHILDALYGYLLLGKAFLDGRDVRGAWNFGPMEEMTVLDVAREAEKEWADITYSIDDSPVHKNMVNLLKIDSTKARKLLGWRNVLSMEKTIEYTITWYRRYYTHGECVSEEQIKKYEILQSLK